MYIYARDTDALFRCQIAYIALLCLTLRDKSLPYPPFRTPEYITILVSVGLECILPGFFTPIGTLVTNYLFEFYPVNLSRSCSKIVRFRPDRVKKKKKKKKSQYPGKQKPGRSQQNIFLVLTLFRPIRIIHQKTNTMNGFYMQYLESKFLNPVTDYYQPYILSTSWYGTWKTSH